MKGDIEICSAVFQGASRFLRNGAADAGTGKSKTYEQ